MVDQSEPPPMTVASGPIGPAGLRGFDLTKALHPKAPDLGSNVSLVATAALMALAMALILALSLNHLAERLGDSDDAMRLVQVRDLLAGRGWYDQWVGRLQPPVGVYLHWSRLLDGALAGAMWLVGQVTSPARAEFIVRLVWPLLWIFPAIACALSIARSLGGRPAVFVCALLCAIHPLLYAQFVPGRLDHHNVQIVMALVAGACAIAPGRRPGLAIAAGVASGLGLAIGIEALAFHALIGASFALRLALDRQDAAVTRAYAVSLAVAVLMFFALQTPPWRWSVSSCDAIGLNLVAATGAAGLGLAGIATWGANRSTAARTALLAVAGAVAGGVYLALDPHCIEGPFGDVDPRLRSIWFNGVGELASWPQLWGLDRLVAFESIAMTTLGLAAAIFLVLQQRRRPTVPVLLALALVAIAGVASGFAVRMENYAFWFGLPVVAAAMGQIATTTLGNSLLPTVVMGLLVSPSLIGSALEGVAPQRAERPVTAANPASSSCFDTDVYRPLAALPAGVVLAQVNLGSFVLAHTRDSALAAPYLVTWGILSAHGALAGPSALAEARTRALHVTYVVVCRAQPLWGGADSLEANLKGGRTPAWLQGLSRPGDLLQIYRVKPPRVITTR